MKRKKVISFSFVRFKWQHEKGKHWIDKSQFNVAGRAQICQKDIQGYIGRTRLTCIRMPSTLTLNSALTHAQPKVQAKWCCSIVCKGKNRRYKLISNAVANSVCVCRYQGFKNAIWRSLTVDYDLRKHIYNLCLERLQILQVLLPPLPRALHEELGPPLQRCQAQ